MVLSQAKNLIAFRPVNHIQQRHSPTLSTQILNNDRHTTFNLHIACNMRSQEHSRVFPERVVLRRRLLFQYVQYGTSQTAFIQCTKQSLFYNVGAASHVNQSSSTRQTIEP